VGLLTFTLAAALLGQQPASPYEPAAKQVWDYLRSGHFDPIPDGPGAPGNGTIRIRGRRINIGFSFAPRSKTEKTLALAGVSFRYAYLPKRKMSDRFALALQREVKEISGGAIEIGLNGYLRLSLDSHFPNMNMETFPMEALRFSEGLRRLQDLVPPDPNPKAPVLDESKKIDFLDDTDAEYLVEQWKWQPRNFGYGGSFIGWFCFMETEGVLIRIQGAHPGEPDLNRVLLISGGEVPKGVVPDEFAKEVARKVSPIDFELIAGTVFQLHQTIDLSPGIEIRELKRQIQSFARRVKPYVRNRSRDSISKQN